MTGFRIRIAKIKIDASNAGIVNAGSSAHRTPAIAITNRIAAYGVLTEIVF